MSGITPVAAAAGTPDDTDPHDLTGERPVPHEHERAGELLVGGVQQLGVVCFGEALAPVRAALASVVHAVDQPRPLTGSDAHQRGQRDALVARTGDLHHRGLAAAAPGAAAAVSDTSSLYSAGRHAVARARAPALWWDKIAGMSYFHWTRGHMWTESKRWDDSGEQG